jgi:hypothetical protein
MSAKTVRVPYAAAASVIALVGICLLSRTTTAFNPQPDPPRFGMVGIADGQTARLNLVNLGIPVNGFAPPCRATLKFFDGDGNLLASQRVDINPGQAAFLDLAPSFAPPANGTSAGLLRAEIRGALTPIDDQYAPPCKASVEVFDNVTGRTSILFPPEPCHTAACRAGQ